MKRRRERPGELLYPSLSRPSLRQMDLRKDIFVKLKDNPPLNKNHPPVAGAIIWERFLLDHMRYPIRCYKEAREMMDSEEGKAVVSKFLEVAMRMRDYEVEHFNQWKAETNQTLPLLMKRSVLIMVNSAGAVCVDSTQLNTTAQGSEKDVEKDVRYSVNFAPELQEIISETKYLDHLGILTSSEAQNVALQEDKFLRYIKGLKKLVNHYHSLMDNLNDAEFSLMADQVQELRRVLSFGCRRVNWNFLGIPQFIQCGNQATSKFESLVNQIQKNERDIDNKLKSTESANLFKFPVADKNGYLPGIKEFCDFIECERAKAVNLRVNKYAAISPLLTKIESLIMGTSTGKSKRMAQFYAYWECKIFDSLSNMVLHNIQAFNTSLMGTTPLFQIDTILAAPEIALLPKSSEVYKLIRQCVGDCVESTRVC